ncbi:MAG TPA: hypothetical protein VJB10_01465 [Candidatus Peribacteraceae bacterium]|nr:hypothetical protein [Candidatus Peribacteraceae bacterium]
MRNILVVHASIMGGIGTLLQPKYPDELHREIPKLDQYSFERLVQSSLEGVTFREDYSASAMDEDTGIAPWQMAHAAAERLQQENFIDVACDAYDWASNYQISYERAAQMQGDKFDCNDPARHACEKLSQPGIPTYFLSTWPTQPRDRLFHDWHQMAVCKLHDRYFFIIDQAKDGIFWHGNLPEFVKQHSMGRSVPMSIIPGVGIARFVEPRYDVAPAKFLLQFAHMRSEGEMASLGIHPRMQPNIQLATNLQ